MAAEAHPRGMTSEPPPQMGVRARLLSALASGRAPLWIGLLAALLIGLPSLAGGLALDDLLILENLQQRAPLDALTGLFELGPQTPEGVHTGRVDGTLPWWTSEALRVRFFRPLSALTHALDHALWPRSPWIMHAHSVAWYLLLVAIVSALYRALVGDPGRARAGAVASALPALALLIYALDDAHAINAGWIAARNSLIGANLAALALLLHVRARAAGRVTLAAFVFALSLLAAESSVAILGYLIAYSLTLDAAGSRRARLRPLLPYALVLVAWLVVYGALGFGASGCGLYTDPLRVPLRFLVVALGRGALLLSAQLGLPMIVELLGFIPGATGPATALALLGALLVAWLLRSLLRRDALARFFAVGALLAAAASGAAVPQERYLLLIGIGGAGLVAIVLRDMLVKTPQRGLGVRALAGIWLALHVILAPALAPVRVGGTALLHSALTRAVEATPDGEAPVVLLNAPGDMVPLYAPAVRRAASDGATPPPMHVLYVGAGALTVERSSARALQLSTPAGWLAAPGDQVFRDRGHPLAVGDRVSLGAVQVEVLELHHGAPSRVALTLPGSAPLEDQPIVWMAWQDGVPQRWTPPETGASRELAPATWDFAAP